ncbi:putative O-methyltransferase YrrM [Kibdelosporangium banguiense]|uniref:O-methyltransferase YrrM n=1 Tax=Kibdelosporangium banguiense TaxID=1365924 RepID=A0ABS4TYC9_9PSEU|nr:class I SAM-dependent methyltransferase [Kibdelosporangium banguiense]MBP2329399.1 putative O-methyltransferase YrrM [Kibdelosporangium banguiense]
MIHNVVVDDAVRQYIDDVNPALDELAGQLRAETLRLPLATMLVPAEQGRLLAFLVSLTGARSVIEVGVFTGFSTLSMARALPGDGVITALDISEEWTAIAERYWEKAGVRDKIKLELRPAVESLDAMIARGAADTVDFVFVDADKESYELYYERCLTLLRQGGLMLLDNVLWSGLVADPDVSDPETDSLRSINARLVGDNRVDKVVLPVFDGLTLLRKL